MLTAEKRSPAEAGREVAAVPAMVGYWSALISTVVGIAYLAPEGRRVLSLLGVIFAAAFMVMVSINRFVQLTVVRPLAAEGSAAGLERWMPYGSRSAMLSLEMVGWGFFLGLALLAAALALPAGGRAGVARRSFLVYAALGIASTVAFAADSPLSIVGFVAWGVVLPFGMAFLAAWFDGMRRGGARAGW